MAYWDTRINKNVKMTLDIEACNYFGKSDMYDN